MFNRFLFIFILSALLISSVAVGTTETSVACVYEINSKSLGTQPPIVEENAKPNVPFYSASVNSVGNVATVYLNTSWASGIYTDDYGNTYWISTTGNVSVYNPYYNISYYLPSIPSIYLFSPFTSVSSVNYTAQSGTSYEYVVLLNEEGYVYAYNSRSGNWFNATSRWNLTLQTYPGPWTSVTSNVENNFYTNGKESFFFVSYSGAVARYTPQGKSYSVLSTGQNLAIISAVANYNETKASSGELYGLEWNGSVYYFDNTWKYWGNAFGAPGSGAVGITIGYDPNNGTQNIFVSSYFNNTPLYESYSQAGAPSSGGFFEAGMPAFDHGTVSAITYDNYDDYFYEIETNGTIAVSTNLTTWYYANNTIPETSYSDVLSIAWTGPTSVNPWTSYAVFKSSQTPWNSLVFNVSFASNRTGSEYNYSDYPLFPTTSLSQPVELSNSYTISVNYIGYPNMMGNSTFYFAVIFLYPMNGQPAVVIAYSLAFIVINHFYYMPVG